MNQMTRKKVSSYDKLKLFTMEKANGKNTVLKRESPLDFPILAVYSGFRK